MAVIAYALPIIPGQEETVEAFAEQLDAAGLRPRYEELNRRAGVTSRQEWIQPFAVLSRLSWIVAMPV